MMRPRRKEHGAALLIVVAVLILGVSWYVFGAIGKVTTVRAEREGVTGRALQEGKRALLAYVTQYAARGDTADPGQMPCPESTSLANPGEASTSCSATALVVGRLPWKTLGIDPLHDGEGEPLWYMMRGFRNPPINFGATGQITYNGSAVVALIIAPGKPLNTLSEPGTPPAGCSQGNQHVSARNTAPLSAANFLECGVTTGSLTSPGESRWTNDRVIAITVEEWIDAIAGAVADRLQRQVAPALIDWRSNEAITNWGELFLPYAAPFNNPATNGLCGSSYGVIEGLMPVSRAASSSCTNWTGGTVTQLAGLLDSPSCAQSGGNYQCQFRNMSIITPLTARVTARAPSVGGSFRRRISTADISNNRGGTVSNFSLTLDSTDGEANISFEMAFPLLAIGTVITVIFPNLPDAALLSDPRMSWFVANDWARHTYYAISHGVKLESTGLSCNPTSYNDCLMLDGVDRQRFIAVLMGRPLASQSRSCATDADADTVMDCDDRDQYLESRVAAAGGQEWLQSRIDAAFNDRLATCPRQYVSGTGSTVTLC